MRILVRQVSGLGNQLFQYAAGRYYAKHYGAELGVAVAPASQAFSHGRFARPFQLSHFSIEAPVRPLSRLDMLYLSGRRSVRAVLAPARKVLGVEVFLEPFDRRYEFMASLPIAADVRTLYLSGYWQTHRTVDAVAEELRREFALTEAATGENKVLLERIAAAPNPVSLHMRRGDYTLAAEGNIALPNSYYAEAIARIQEALEEPTFFIFSDDIEYARRHLPQGISKVFVEHNDDFSSQEDLRLMSRCRSHIIANSTFSWWGAWLNPDPDKLVIAPRHWLLKEDSYYPDLLAPDWVLLDTARTEEPRW